VRSEELVVRTRLIPPRIRADVVDRPRLRRELTGLFSVPLTVVKADAGYGKSTGVAAFLRGSSHPYFWYSLSEADADPLLFLLHVVWAIRGTLPHCGTRALSLLDREGGVATLWAPAVDALANDLLDHLERDAVLVLDDYHLADRPQVQAILGRLIEHMPPQLHVVLVTRHTPRLAPMVRWQARGDVLEIGRDALAFTAEEVAALFEVRLGGPLSPDSARALATETEGWAIALLMVCQQVRGEGAAGLERLLGRLPDSLPGLFVYLLEDVLATQPPEIRTFLAQTSVLRHLDAESCDALLERSDSAARLRYLDDHSLFVVGLGGGTYRYHHLFQEFLLRSLGDEPRAALHRRAATYYVGRGNREEAIYHLLEAGHHTAAAELLSGIAPALIQAGRYESLARWLDRLPESLVESSPSLGISRGDARRLTSRYQEALTSYEVAYRAAQAAGATTLQSRARTGQALIYLDTVQPVLAEPFLQESLRLAKRIDRESRLALYGLLAENRVNQGRLRQAGRLLDVVRRAQARQAPAEIGVRLAVRAGRLSEAREILEHELRVDPWGIGKHRMPRSHREPAVILAWICALTGDAEEGRRYAEIGLQVGRELHSPIVECVALARLGHAWLCGADADAGRALGCYQQSRDLAQRIEVERFAAEALLGSAIARGRLGDFAAAEHDARRALAILEAAGDGYLAAIVQLVLGSAGVVCRVPDADRWLSEAEAAGRACGDAFGPAVAVVWQAVRARQLGDWSSFDTAAGRALAVARDHAYGFLFLRQTMLGPDPLVHSVDVLRTALHRGLEVEYARALLEEMSDRYPEIAAPSTARPTWVEIASTGRRPALYIQALGEFRVWYGERELPREAWSRESALRLFQLLLCHRGRPVPREVAAEALWPDASPESSATRLRVTLAATNRALEPDRPRGIAPTIVRSTGRGLQLNPAVDLQLDADIFVRLIERARSREDRDVDGSLALYRRALRLYQGDFLAECAYADWAAEERERLLSLFLATAARTAHLLADREQYGEAIDLCQRILERDPCWEDAYYLLMRCYAARGDRSLAMRTYQRCAARLLRDLGVPPSPRTTALRDAIARSRPPDVSPSSRSS
jgi:ATP/maltotriose-dependent transcriptional regulator MalT/DNA-binding SARP family transcriptional activator